MKKLCDNCLKKFDEDDLIPVDMSGEDCTHNSDQAVADWCKTCVEKDGGKS